MTIFLVENPNSLARSIYNDPLARNDRALESSHQGGFVFKYLAGGRDTYKKMIISPGQTDTSWASSLNTLKVDERGDREKRLCCFGKRYTHWTPELRVGQVDAPVLETTFSILSTHPYVFGSMYLNLGIL